MCHTRELAFQISKEYERFSKFLAGVKVNRIIISLFCVFIKGGLLLLNSRCHGAGFESMGM